VRWLAALAALPVIALPVGAHAERLTYQPDEEPRTFARAGGPVLVHYATRGVNAALPDDLDASGVPDFVEEVADRAAESLAAYAERGFRAPLGDEGLEDNGGDGRLDVYLFHFGRADGFYGTDQCTDAPSHCIGHVVMENDFAGLAYATPSLGIRVLVSHELFHGVQYAYDTDQPGVWAEGTAVWAEEILYPEQEDFERLTASLLAEPSRPFEGPSGFGEGFPYGAGLWAYYLGLVYGEDVIAAIWERCEASPGADPGFLDATDAELAARGSSLEAAWIEFTRWNAETGARAAPGRYPDAGRLALAAREPALTAPGTTTVMIEGMSARYLPVTGIAGDVRIVVEGDAIAAAVRAPGADVTGGSVGVAARHEIVVAGASELDVIVTGAGRGGAVRPVTVSVTPAAIVEPAPMAGDGGSCAAGPGPGPLLLLVIASLAARRRRHDR
jgi:MYXO-CTERM domain-containing protein